MWGQDKKNMQQKNREFSVYNKWYEKTDTVRQ